MPASVNAPCPFCRITQRIDRQARRVHPDQRRPRKRPHPLIDRERQRVQDQLRRISRGAHIHRRAELRPGLAHRRQSQSRGDAVDQVRVEPGTRQADAADGRPVEHDRRVAAYRTRKVEQLEAPLHAVGLIAANHQVHTVQLTLGIERIERTAQHRVHADEAPSGVAVESIGSPGATYGRNPPSESATIVRLSESRAAGSIPSAPWPVTSAAVVSSRNESTNRRPSATGARHPTGTRAANRSRTAERRAQRSSHVRERVESQRRDEPAVEQRRWQRRHVEQRRDVRVAQPDLPVGGRSRLSSRRLPGRCSSAHRPGPVASSPDADCRALPRHAAAQYMGHAAE